MWMGLVESKIPGEHTDLDESHQESQSDGHADQKASLMGESRPCCGLPEHRHLLYPLTSWNHMKIAKTVRPVSLYDNIYVSHD